MPPQEKVKRVAESTYDAIVQKKKAPKVREGLLKDVCKTRQTEEGRQTSPNPIEKAATSVHKYWTSTWEWAVDQASLLELVKMAEISIVRSHVLNCELYKVFEGHAELKAMGTKGDGELHSENRALRSKLALVDEARAQAEYKLMKTETIQRVCINARKWAELK
ncbi:hypothetical protein Fot_14970 [Forsythia ovata]|uniref:Uncharacterized protein n=1 Tax=Forsythia ovata TaxID=205694 RepID=A0ABD1W852_9LAMI